MTGHDEHRNTDALGDGFTYRYQDIHRSTQRITQLVPGTRVVWHVLDAYLAFTDDPAEWTGTVLRRLLQRLGPLRQHQPAQPHHDRRRTAESG